MDKLAISVFRNRPFAIFALIFLLTLPALWTGLVADDYMHHAILSAKELPIDKPDDLSLFGLFSFINGDPERTRMAMDLGVIPWWTYGEMKYAFWRPLAELTHWLDHQLWPGSPALMHLHNLAWYLGICFLLLLLYRRTLTLAGTALLALALYGLDSTHGFALSWIANRNGLIACFFGMATLYSHIRYREHGHVAWLATSLICMLAALLAAELGISTFGYLAAYALCADPKGRIKGLLACAPHFIVIVAWWLTYKWAGFGASNADAYYVDPASHPLTFLTNFVQRATILLASQWGIIPAELYGYGALQMDGYVLVCGLYLILIGLFILPTGIGQPYVRMWLLGMLLSLVPATTALPQDRVLTFVGVGASATLAHFLHLVICQKTTVDPFPRWSATVIAGFLLVLHLIVSPLLMPLASYSTKALSDGLISPRPSEFANIDNIEDKRLVLIGTPLASALAIAPLRFYRGEPIPARLWLLSSLEEDIEVIRTADNQVLVSLDSGFIQGAEIGVRDFSRFPFTQGEQIRLGGMTIEIRKLNDKGMPTELALQFDQSLEAMKVLFLRWDNDTASYSTLPLQ